MPTLSAWAIRTALVWLALATLIGALILARAEIGLPRLILLRPAHAEMMLVGWMMQLARDFLGLSLSAGTRNASAESSC